VDSDQLLRRFERTAAAACVAMALVALALPRGGPSAAAAVVGGWLLIELALRAIRSGVDALARGARPALNDTSPQLPIAPLRRHSPFARLGRRTDDLPTRYDR